LRREANRFTRLDARGKPKEYVADDPGGVGWEIAREVLACSDCAIGRK
jgi:hypothetical protein